VPSSHAVVGEDDDHDAPLVASTNGSGDLLRGRLAAVAAGDPAHLIEPDMGELALRVACGMHGLPDIEDYARGNA
jgi:hypothetical protein